jgi:dynein intermediate chain
MSVYSKSDDSNLNDPHGLILLWNLNKKKQEYSIICQTEITSAIFHKHNPNLIIGGTYTGQIIVWDTRGKPVPVQKTPSGGKYHSHPIYCLGMTGSLNSNNIISISNDGVLCTWSQANLSKNSKHIFLRAKKKKGNETTFDNGSNQYMEEIGAICMATSETEPNNILIGTDESELYQVCTNQSK